MQLNFLSTIFSFSVCSPDLSTSLADKWKLMQNEGLVDHLVT